MAKETAHPDYCRKEKEIAEIHTQMKTINGIVMGNGQPGLITIVPELAANVERLSDTAETLATAVGGLVRFQESLIGTECGKEKIRKRNRWVIGILVTAITVMGGSIIGLILKVMELVG